MGKDWDDCGGECCPRDDCLCGDLPQVRMTERAHDLEAARNVYRRMTSDELLYVARGLVNDAKAAFRPETVFFALERILLVTEIARMKEPGVAEAPSVRLVKGAP